MINSKKWSQIHKTCPSVKSPTAYKNVCRQCGVMNSSDLTVFLCLIIFTCLIYIILFEHIECLRSDLGCSITFERVVKFVMKYVWRFDSLVDRPIHWKNIQSAYTNLLHIEPSTLFLNKNINDSILCSLQILYWRDLIKRVKEKFCRIACTDCVEISCLLYTRLTRQFYLTCKTAIKRSQLVSVTLKPPKQTASITAFKASKVKVVH